MITLARDSKTCLKVCVSPWPFDTLQYIPKRGASGWTSYVARIIVPWLFLIFDLLDLIGMSVDHRTRIGKRRRLGHENYDKTERIVNGELRDIVTIAASSLCGVFATKGLEGDAGKVGFMVLFFLVLVGVMIGHRWLRRLEKASSEDAWEPGGVPYESLTKLYKNWNDYPASGWTWPALAVIANEYRKSSVVLKFWKISRFHIIISSLLVPIILVAMPLFLSIGAIPSLRLAGIYLAANILSIILRGCHIYCTVRWDANCYKQRATVLTASL